MNNVDNFNLKSNQENDEQNDEASLSAENAEGIKNIGSVLTGREDTLIHCLTIIGQIEGHYILPSQNKTTKYEHIIPLLVSVEEDPNVKGLLILLNTVLNILSCSLFTFLMIFLSISTFSTSN